MWLDKKNLDMEAEIVFETYKRLHLRYARPAMPLRSNESSIADNAIPYCPPSSEIDIFAKHRYHYQVVHPKPQS
jgi:hypothetical protein